MSRPAPTAPRRAAIRGRVAIRGRAAVAVAGLLGLAACAGPPAVAGGPGCATCPPIAPSVGFAPGVTVGPPVVVGPAFAPACGPTCGPVGCRPYGRVLPHLPRPWPCYDGPRRLSGAPSYRPFGLPMLSEIGAALGGGVGALMDDVLLGPDVGSCPLKGCGPCGPCGPYAACRPGCRTFGRPACGMPCPPPCAAPRLAIRPFRPPFTAECGHAGCGLGGCLLGGLGGCDAGCGPVCPPPLAPRCPIARRLPPVSSCAAPCGPAIGCAPELVPLPVKKFARRQCVTVKEVECVGYRKRRECYVEPVTRVECRTVDRGCYKKVWCPKLVTEEICKTDYVRRVRVRTEPYTYTKPVVERTEHLVPYCGTAYVPAPPTCGAPAFVPPTCAAPPVGFEGGLFDHSAEAGFGVTGETFGSMSAPQYGTPQSVAPQFEGYDTGVPPSGYALPGAPPATLSAPREFGPLAPPAPSAPLTPTPSDDFRGDLSGDDAPIPQTWTPVPQAKAAAAVGWTEQPGRARRF